MYLHSLSFIMIFVVCVFHQNLVKTILHITTLNNGSCPEAGGAEVGGERLRGGGTMGRGGEREGEDGEGVRRGVLKAPGRERGEREGKG